MEWPMFSSARCGMVRMSRDVRVVDAVAGIDLKPELVGVSRGRLREMLRIPARAFVRRIGKGAGVQFDRSPRRGAARHRSARASGSMKRLTRMPAACSRRDGRLERLNCWPAASSPPSVVISVAVFRHEADFLRQHAQRDVEDLRRVAHLEIQLGHRCSRAGGRHRDPGCAGDPRAGGP